jgi:hypothetical protein
MKTKIKSPNDALVFILEGLLHAEVKLVSEFPSRCIEMSSNRLREAVNGYIASAENKLLKP